MKYEDLLYKFFSDDPVLRHKIKNKRRQLSDKIMVLETKCALTQKEAAKVIGISLDYLLLMESVSLKIPVNEYIYAIQKLQAYKNKQLIEKQRANKI